MQSEMEALGITLKLDFNVLLLSKLMKPGQRLGDAFEQAHSMAFLDRPMTSVPSTIFMRNCYHNILSPPACCTRVRPTSSCSATAAPRGGAQRVLPRLARAFDHFAHVLRQGRRLRALSLGH